MLGDGFGDVITEEIEKTVGRKEKRRKLKAAFSAADADGSKAISPAELTRALGAFDMVDGTANFTPGQIALIVAEADTDGDGEIDWEEFQAVIDKHFKQEFQQYSGRGEQAPQTPAAGDAETLRAKVRGAPYDANLHCHFLSQCEFSIHYERVWG